jgi:sugar O-acyltransferase (sialic acid O-acetyltransferase NeuD family)
MIAVLLLGGGGHCKSVIDVIEQERKYSIAGIIDKKELIGTSVLGYEVIGCDDDLQELFKKFQHAVITVGHVKSNAIRVKLFTLLKEIGYALPVVVSPLAYVSKRASVDEGTVIMHHALLNACAKVGKNCIINTKALCEHDCVIENHTHVSTGAIVNGGAIVKANSFVGSSSVVVECATVSGFLKAGSLNRVRP